MMSREVAAALDGLASAATPRGAPEWLRMEIRERVYGALRGCVEEILRCDLVAASDDRERVAAFAALAEYLSGQPVRFNA
jgi:hypothetical protein